MIANCRLNKKSAIFNPQSTIKIMPEPVDIAIISISPAPYRQHVLRRIVRELPWVRLHSIFTHALDKESLHAWEMKVEPELNPVHFQGYALGGRKPVCSASIPHFRRIREYLLEHRVKFVLLMGYADLTRLLLIRWARQVGMPLLVTADSNIFAEGRVRGLKRLVKRPFMRWLIRTAGGFTPMGTCGRAYLRAYADHDKPVFPFPYEPDYEVLAHPEPQTVKAFAAQYTLDPHRRRLLFCGRLIPVKRVDVLLDAFARIADQRPEWDVLVAGEGPLLESLKARVPQALKSRVLFPGFLQFDQTVPCYHNCDVLVLPSEYEPWALVVNEAVACGLAVIATEVVGAAADLVTHHVNGLIVPPRNVQALADAILEVSRPDKLAAMKAAAPDALKRWRQAADPIQGLAAALRHFNLTPSPLGRGQG